MSKSIAKGSHLRNLGVFAACLFIFPTVFAKNLFESSHKQVHLLELFSTQSCSSCPPAQAWVSDLKTSPQLWKTFIPVVFHVDYWDYLGWKDPYSNSEFSLRQKQYVNEWFNSGAYTPMFVLDGAENRERSLSELTSYGDNVGILKVIEKEKNIYEIEFRPAQKTSESLYLNYAVLGSNITTRVTAGENEGLKLKHDFLALKKEQLKMIGKNQVYSLKLNLNLDKEHPAPQRALVFWVNGSSSLKPIQAVGGWFKE